ncbi:hypothetical protein ACQEVB_10735 [Pseudonocardia sp. CA-107938]|uniref:hypothetical protein n=1 Tax=Pseudonocardia sp. CA-107938 TaxID=3240021 RepID=UPI003D8CB938
MRTITRSTARVAVAIAVLAAAMAGSFAGTASAAPLPQRTAVQEWTALGTTPSPTWCPLGKAHKGGKGCRGGSLVPKVDVGSVHKTVGAVTVNCSVGSCSIYISRSATKELNEHGDLLVGGSTSGATGLAAALGISGQLAVVVGAAVTLNAQVVRDTIKQAAEHHGKKGACFKITKPHVPGLGGLGMAVNSYTHYSTNNGPFCKD